MTTSETQLRAPGRPRCAVRDAAIVTAAIELLADEGFAGLSIEGIAARAGVGKSTIYRRWPNKDALVLEALSSISETVAVAVSGTPRDNVVELLDAVRTKSSSPEGRAFLRVVGEAINDSDLMASYYDRVFLPRREALRVQLQAAVDAGDLRPDVDLDLAADLLVGPLLYRLLLQRPGAEVTRGWLEQAVDTALSGLSPRP